MYWSTVSYSLPLAGGWISMRSATEKINNYVWLATFLYFFWLCLAPMISSTLFRKGLKNYAFSVGSTHFASTVWDDIQNTEELKVFKNVSGPYLRPKAIRHGYLLNFLRENVFVLLDKFRTTGIFHQNRKTLRVRLTFGLSSNRLLLLNFNGRNMPMNCYVI
jgi:hypothetical protein